MCPFRLDEKTARFIDGNKENCGLNKQLQFTKVKHQRNLNVPRLEKSIRHHSNDIDPDDYRELPKGLKPRVQKLWAHFEGSPPRIRTNASDDKEEDGIATSFTLEAVRGRLREAKSGLDLDDLFSKLGLKPRTKEIELYKLDHQEVKDDTLDEASEDRGLEWRPEEDDDHPTSFAHGSSSPVRKRMRNVLDYLNGCPSVSIINIS